MRARPHSPGLVRRQIRLNIFLVGRLELEPRGRLRDQQQSQGGWHR